MRSVGFKAAVELLGSVPTPTEPAKEKTPRIEELVASGNGSPLNASGSIGSESANSELKPLAKDTWRKFSVACPWLEERIPDAGVRERFGVFCYNNPARKSAWSGRVMIPIKDAEGVLFGYLGRLVPTQDTQTHSTDNPPPKYLLPKGFPKSRFLFGAHEILAGTFGSAPLKRVWLVESPFCVMKFAMWKIPCVSPFGWSVSEEQLQLLTTLTRGVVYLPDNNKRKDAEAFCQRLATHLWLRFPPLPESIDDPEALTAEQIRSL